MGEGAGPCLASPPSFASSGQHGGSAQLGQTSNAAAALTSKGQATSVILVEGEDLPMQVLTKYLSFQHLTSAALMVFGHRMGT